MKHYDNFIKNQIVKFTDINLSDDTYRITTETDFSNLKLSIKKSGLLNPPLLKKNNSKYTIISGFRRIEACRSLECSHITARILDQETKKQTCAELAIAENALQRPLNLVEQSRAIRLISGCAKNSKTLSKELSILGLPENQSIIKKIEKICYFSTSIQNAILSNTIVLPMALMLGELPGDVGNHFVSLFEKLKISLNKQREIVALATEIAMREDIAILKVFDEKELHNVLNHPELDRSQKGRLIRSYLKRRRFPAITRAEAAFELLTKQLKLGKNVQLIPPENYESSTYRLTLRFKNLIELDDCKTTLEKIAENPALKSFLADKI